MRQVLGRGQTRKYRDTFKREQVDTLDRDLLELRVSNDICKQVFYKLLVNCLVKIILHQVLADQPLLPSKIFWLLHQKLSIAASLALVDP